MGTIADKLVHLAECKADIKDAIEAQGVAVGDAVLADYADKISQIEGGGGASGWQPHPDWYNIKAVYDADVQEGYNKRYIYLLPDTSNDIALTGGDAYKTSDGAFYTSNVTHTWDRAHDKPCSDGYKTRWVIVYNTSRDVAINHRSVPSMWLYLGDCNVTLLTAGQYGVSNRLLAAIQCDDGGATANASAVGAEAFYECRSLVLVEIPPGVTSIGSVAFRYCSSLEYVKLPHSVTSIVSGAFRDCYCLHSVNFPAAVTAITESLFNLCYSLHRVSIPDGVTSIGVSAFYDCYNLSSVYIPSSVVSILGTSAITYAFYRCYALTSVTLGANFDANNLWLNDSPLSVSSMLNMFAALKDNTGLTAKTLTLGATNLAKLTDDEKAIATNKNWILA